MLVLSSDCIVMFCKNLHCPYEHSPLSEDFHPVSLGSKLCPFPEHSEHSKRCVKYDEKCYPTFCFEGVRRSPTVWPVVDRQLSKYASNLSSQWDERNREGTKVVGGMMMGGVISNFKMGGVTIEVVTMGGDNAIGGMIIGGGISTLTIRGASM